MARKNLSFTKFLKKIYRLYSPYFGLSDQFGWNSVYMGCLLIGNILSAVLMNSINVAFGVFNGVLLQPTITYALLFQSCATVTWLMGAYGILIACTDWLARTLGLSLAQSINENITNKWMQTGAYYGIDTINPKKESPDLADILSHDVPHLSTDIISLTNLALMTVGNFVVGMAGLYPYSHALSFTLGSLTVTIPGYLMIATLAYAGIFHIITHYFGDSVKTRENELRQKEELSNQKIHHVTTHREEIAFHQGVRNENTSILTTLQQSFFVQKTLNAISSVLLMLNIFQQQFANIVAIIIASPNMIAGKIPLDSVWGITRDFQLATGLFSFRSQYLENLTTCEVSLQRIDKLNKQIAGWEKFSQKRKSNLKFVADERASHITIKDLTVKTKNKKTILHHFNMKVPKGKITFIKGHSNSGKTTLLRALAGLGTLTKGTIKGLPTNTVFLPDKPYFPFKQSLLNALFYPHLPEDTAKQRRLIHTLMREMNLTHLKPRLDEVADWNAELSGGEKQRCMVIAAIIKQPDCLVMDEPTARADQIEDINTKEKIENSLKKHLRGKTIIFTDQSPSGNFHDKVITMPNRVITTPKKAKL